MIDHDFQNEISRALGRLEGKIDEGFEAIKAIVSDHEKRIRSTESDISHAKGVVAIIGSIAGLVASAVLSFVKRIWE